MGKQIFGPILAGRSTADYSGATIGRYRFFVHAGTASSVDGVPNVTRAASAGVECIGVQLEKPKTGETASVQTYDVCKVEAGAAIATIGTKVATDNQGRAVTVATTNFTLGETLDVASAAGDIISVRLYPVHPIAP